MSVAHQILLLGSETASCFERADSCRWGFRRLMLNSTVFTEQSNTVDGASGCSAFSMNMLHRCQSLPALAHRCLTF